MKLFEVKVDYKIFVDLDGVLADLDKHLKQITGKTFMDLRGVNHDENGFALFVADERAQGHSVFDQLDMMPDADLLWNYIVKYNPSILTATGQPHEIAKAEKIRWVHENLTGFDQIYVVPGGRDKYHFAAPNHILIDDSDKNIADWSNRGGIAIRHVSAADTIRQLQQLSL